MAKTKVAVLGGGMGSIATAFSLTTPALRAKYEVTIYQLGWRIGGKGASGRNQQCANRIEEHGLHIWFGFYDNAFRMMRQCYDELGRPASTPLARLDDAFKPADDFILYEEYKGRWIPHPFHAPRNTRVPGDNSPIPQFWQIAENALRWVLSLWTSVVGRGASAIGPAASNSLSEQWHRLAVEIGAVITAGASFGAGSLLTLAYELSSRLAFGGLPTIVNPHAILRGLLTEFRNWLWTWIQPQLDDDELRFLFTTVDLLTAIVEGIVTDDLLTNGMAAINEEDFGAWLTRHGVQRITRENSVFARMTYSAAFAFVDGDIAQPNLASGVALSVLLWILFTYKGSLFYKMQAGMGDTVFAPFYQVLKARGVKFKFFNAVEKLHISGTQVDSIEVTEQVQLSVAEYDPLVTVDTLPCWPSEPLWDQIKDGDSLKSVDLEEKHNPPGAKSRTLKRGVEFDIVVLGISVATLPAICDEIYRDDANFRAMIDNSRTTMTQGFQLWMNKDVRQLGWPYGNEFIMSTYVEPLDTWADMSQLIPRESWPASANVRSVQYFCGVLADIPGDSQRNATGRARTNAIAYLSNDAGRIWPGALTGGAFDWDTLVDPNNGQRSGRFDSQFWRANFQKTERYVLSPAGSIKFRLRTDGTRYRNLYLTGDWIECGGDAGCIECAVVAGMLAASAITNSRVPISRADHRWLI